MSRSARTNSAKRKHIAILPPITGLLDFALDLQHTYERQTSIEERKGKGQYFTPLEVCKFMAGLLSKPARDRYRLLDPGAGAGSLTAAVCERLSEACTPLDIEVVLFENDRIVLPYLKRTMVHCRTELERAGHALTVELHESDFILDAAASLQGNRGLFDEAISIGEVDGVIMNPPYFKLNKNSEYARVMNAVVHGQPNIYSFFLAASAQMLRPGGEMVAITPRSFCNGLYFRGFRHWFFERMALDRIHLFESRTDTFRDVLQESIITHSHRLGRHSTRITVSTSYGRDVVESLQSRALSAADVMDSSTGDCIIRVPASDEDSAILEAVESWPDRFSDLGLRVSTGPVVTFRAREFLLHGANGTVGAPLLSTLNVKPFETVWPALHKKHPNAFKVCPASMKLLLPSQNYVLLRRFSAKEERRRLTASCWIGTSQPGPYVALENHLNYIYHATRPLSLDEAYGLAALFNSALLDRYFRSISGNTQVNATELRTMPLPSLKTVAAIGCKIRALTTLQGKAIERIVLDAVGINGSLGQHLMDAAGE
ncbi:MAG TPA: Eco57I restriction-modification methylase domain-containing protein [Bryobacteraceae bacterium]|nr:Eco57I restriction-modification methylase domain-containing protein [Bryobacteraceae bacterium]